MKKSLTLITTLSISLMLTACGGGSSTGGTASGTTTLSQAKIDTSNQKEVTALLFDYVVTPEKPKRFPKIGTSEAIKGYNNNQET